MKFKNKILITTMAATMAILSGCETTTVQNIVAQGSATTNETLKPVNQNKVKIYYGNQGLPKHYKVIGRVTAETYNLVGLEHSQTAIAEELKKQAAGIGANGVINLATGMTQTTGDAILTK